VSVHFERARAPAQQTASLEKLDAATGIFELHRGREARKAAADDRYAGRSHEPNTTRSFSRFESAARSRSGNCGSRSIFCRIPS